MIQTLKHLAYTLQVELSELEYIIKNIDNFYKQREEIKLNIDGLPKIKKGVIQKRILNPSKNRLKVIQKRINKNILQQITIPEYAFGSIKGKTNILNSKKHQGKKYIFTTDLKNYFPSINNKRVFETFRSLNFSPTVSKYLTELTTYKGRLPQGAPTSSSLSNLAFIKIGKELEKFSKKNNLTFTTYIDDLTFSSSIDFKEKTTYIIDLLIKDGFKISHNKTNYKTKNPIVTGIKVHNNNIAISDALKIKLENTEGKTELQVAGLKAYAQRIKDTNK